LSRACRRSRGGETPSASQTVGVRWCRWPANRQLPLPLRQSTQRSPSPPASSCTCSAAGTLHLPRPRPGVASGACWDRAPPRWSRSGCCRLDSNARARAGRDRLTALRRENCCLLPPHLQLRWPAAARPPIARSPPRGRPDDSDAARFPAALWRPPNHAGSARLLQDNAREARRQLRRRGHRGSRRCRPSLWVRFRALIPARAACERPWQLAAERLRMYSSCSSLSESSRFPTCDARCLPEAVSGWMRRFARG